MASVESSALAIVIMAAGKGTRLKSRRPKVLHEIGGKPLLSHVIAAAAHIVPPAHIYAVVGHQAQDVKAAVAASGIRFVEQAVQRGTGHAVQSAKDAIKGYKNVLVLSGDAPLIQPETLSALLRFHQAHNAAMTLTSAEPAEPTGYGRVIHPASGSVDVVAIVEQNMLAPEQLSLREVNMGLYAFRTAPLLAHLDKLQAANPLGELYLTDMAHVLHAAGERVVAFQTADPNELLGANTIAEMMALDASLRLATARRLMAAGVTIFRPETCVIDAEVEVAPDTVIEPFVQLLGRTRIGSDCRIRSYTVVENCTLGNRVVLLQSCVLADSSIADGANLGPFTRLRPGCEIGEDVHMGNFVEGKKAKLRKGVKAGHLAYLGDAEIGEDSNIGAGVITCNYDGISKHATTIGKNVFIGSDSTLVAPVTVGDGAYVGAGSCITKEVPPGSLSVGRARQVTKEGWAEARRARRHAQQTPDQSER
ncbi:MAG: bifunctional UDP-N-acetylglucosamine diphosphorylase/glucosamine-1-phosphate N-acetyltransferase GlmU [Terracidiphilus sp.]|nr:bifunctional UDP-N-acetylglucosamine diphosphorylase/glucosamine-1-phosphate N-acetyltransferase GlmU [Terracidiphilus sp.]